MLFQDVIDATNYELGILARNGLLPRESQNIKKPGTFFCIAVSFVTKTFLANPLISEIYDTPAAFGAQLQPVL